MRLKSGSYALLAGIWLSVAMHDVVQAAPSAAVRELEQRLQRHVTVSWQGQQLGRAVERLAQSQQVVVWLDRRVDPQQRVNLQLRDARLDEAFAALAANFGLGIATLGGIVYIGPQHAARELPALADKARDALADATAATRRRWLRAATSDWPRLSEPRSLLKAMLADAKLELIDGERVPHDLWGARQLPAMALVDRVVLVLVGFDLTCAVTDSGNCRVVAIQWPVGAKTPSGSSLQKRGRREPTAEHRLERVFSLRLEDKAVGQVLEQLAVQLELELVWDKSMAPAIRDTRVSCDLNNVKLAELLDGVLRPAGLRAERVGQRLEIQAAE